MSLQEKLKNVAQKKPASIKAFVAQEALDHESFSCFFNDLAAHGCRSGMVGSLIYYNQTHQFFDIYYEQINDLRLEFEESTGEPVNLGSDLKNTLAWFSFEEIANQLANELEIT